MLALSIKLGCPTDDIEILLEEGADADAVAVGTGVTPLQLAIVHLNLVVVRILLEHGANPRRQNNRGVSAWGYAECQGYSNHPEYTRLLRQFDRAFDATSLYDATPTNCGSDATYEVYCGSDACTIC